jgi:hypothetical protein
LMQMAFAFAVVTIALNHCIAYWVLMPLLELRLLLAPAALKLNRSLKN